MTFTYVYTLQHQRDDLDQVVIHGRPKLYAIRTFLLKNINERKTLIEFGGKSPNERGKPSCPYLNDLSETNNDLHRTSCTFSFIIDPKY